MASAEYELGRIANALERIADAVQIRMAAVDLPTLEARLARQSAKPRRQPIKRLIRTPRP